MCQTGPIFADQSLNSSSSSNSNSPSMATFLLRRSSLLPKTALSSSNRQKPILPIFSFPFCFSRLIFSRPLSLLLTLILIISIWRVWIWGENARLRTTVIVVTPTHKRPERLADMTRVVIEDANTTFPAVQRILERSGLPFTYFFATTKPGFPKRGWTHRNVALEYVRKNYANFNGNAVLYFADDDNTYDIRIFDKYIKRVKSIGIWAVGLAGGANVEAPHVVNGTITSWDVVYAPQRRFAVDMAGFAINLRLILGSNATFHMGCVKFSPESCFLAQFEIPREKIEPFGWNEQPKEILVWHTKTKNIGTKGNNHGYVVEN